MVRIALGDENKKQIDRITNLLERLESLIKQGKLIIEIRIEEKKDA